MSTLYDAQIQPSVDAFVANQGRQPSTPQEWSTVYRASYPNTASMPAEFQKVVNLAAQSANTPITSRQSELGVLGLQQGQAGQQFQQASQAARTGGATMGKFNILQDALREKQGKQELGTSSIFEKAGLTGYGALAASLQSRAKEMDINYENYSNTIQSVFSGVDQQNRSLIDAAQISLDNYKMISDKYKEVSDQIFTLERDEQNYQRDVDLRLLDATIQKQLKKYESDLDKVSPSENGETVDEQLSQFTEGELALAEEYNKGGTLGSIGAKDKARVLQAAKLLKEKEEVVSKPSYNNEKNTTVIKGLVDEARGEGRTDEEIKSDLIALGFNETAVDMMVAIETPEQATVGSLLGQAGLEALRPENNVVTGGFYSRLFGNK